MINIVIINKLPEPGSGTLLLHGFPPLFDIHLIVPAALLVLAELAGLSLI